MSKHKKELELYKKGIKHPDLFYFYKTEKQIEKQAYHKLFIQFLKLWSKETVAFKEIEELGKKFGLDVKYHKPTKIKGRWEIKEKVKE